MPSVEYMERDFMRGSKSANIIIYASGSTNLGRNADRSSQ